MKILFVLSGNLSTTPRAVKNIELALKYYDVEIIKVNLHQKWNNLDRDYNYKKIVAINVTKKNIKWLIFSIYHKLCNFFIKIFKHNLKINAAICQKNSLFILHNLKKLSPEYDLIIAQGGGAIWPVYEYAHKNDIQFGIDIEDYHPGEFPRGALLQNCWKAVLKKTLPKANYITYASPIIGTNIQNLIQNKIQNTILLNNAFPASEFISPKTEQKKNQSEKLKFVWFSQTIDKGRGLENFIRAASKHKNRLTLNLFGNIVNDFYEKEILPNIDFIKINQPISQKQLHKKLSDYNIGLALETDEASFNRQICWTNKLFAYAQAGLYILATNTSGQKQFIETNPWAGQLTGHTIDEISNTIYDLINNKEKINKEAKNRYLKAKSIAYEHEEVKLISIWNKILNPS